LQEIADQFHDWVKNRCEKWDAATCKLPKVEDSFRHSFSTWQRQHGTHPRVIADPLGHAKVDFNIAP
jgi:integrase